LSREFLGLGVCTFPGGFVFTSNYAMAGHAKITNYGNANVSRVEKIPIIFGRMSSERPDSSFNTQLSLNG
jgi:hypothetical protein